MAATYLYPQQTIPILSGHGCRCAIVQRFPMKVKICFRIPREILLFLKNYLVWGIGDETLALRSWKYVKGYKQERIGRMEQSTLRFFS